jgi:hypothetical protein
VHYTFHTPISQQAAHELLLLNPITHQVQLNQQDKDVCTYIWGTTKYASSKFYALNFHSIEAPSAFRWIWKSKVTKKNQNLHLASIQNHEKAALRLASAHLSAERGLHASLRVVGGANASTSA